MRGAAHVAFTGSVEVYTGLLLESLRERDHLEDTDIDGTVILKRIFRTGTSGWRLRIR